MDSKNKILENNIERENNKKIEENNRNNYSTYWKWDIEDRFTKVEKMINMLDDIKLDLDIKRRIESISFDDKSSSDFESSFFSIQRVSDNQFSSNFEVNDNLGNNLKNDVLEEKDLKIGENNNKLGKFNSKNNKLNLNEKLDSINKNNKKRKKTPKIIKILILFILFIGILLGIFYGVLVFLKA